MSKKLPLKKPQQKKVSIQKLSQLSQISNHLNTMLNGRPISFLNKQQEQMVKSMLNSIDKLFIEGIEVLYEDHFEEDFYK